MHLLHLCDDHKAYSNIGSKRNVGFLFNLLREVVHTLINFQRLHEIELTPLRLDVLTERYL